MYEEDGSESEAQEIDFDVDYERRDDDMVNDEPPEQMTDVEADADTLASAGMGTDEDYGYFGDTPEYNEDN